MSVELMLSSEVGEEAEEWTMLSNHLEEDTNSMCLSIQMDDDDDFVGYN